jgi:superfamily I DNA and RNA helicase
MDSEQKIQEYKENIVQQIQQLRQESGIKSDRIALYITDTPLVRGILHEYADEIRQTVNAANIVQVDIDAGIPQPEEHPHHTFPLGEDKVTISIEKA